jgi:hypothetical protein
MHYVKRSVVPDYPADARDRREIREMRTALHGLDVNSHIIKSRYFVYEPGIGSPRRVNYADTMSLRTEYPGKVNDVSARTRSTGFDHQQDFQKVFHA